MIFAIIIPWPCSTSLTCAANHLEVTCLPNNKEIFEIGCLDMLLISVQWWQFIGQNYMDIRESFYGLCRLGFLRVMSVSVVTGDCTLHHCPPLPSYVRVTDNNTDNYPVRISEIGVCLQLACDVIISNLISIAKASPESIGKPVYKDHLWDQKWSLYTGGL